MPFAPRSSSKSVIAAMLGVAIFSTLDAMMKIIATTYPVAQATGMRYCAAAIVSTVYYSIRIRRWPERASIIKSIPRTLANVAAGTCFFFAIARLPLVDAIVLTFLSPFFLAIWGRWLLKEALKPMTLVAAAFGLVGVWAIARGQVDHAHNHLDALGFAAAMACAALYALSMVLTRGDSRTESIPTLVLLPSVLGAVVSAPAMILSWRPVEISHCLIVGCVGLLATTGYACLAWAYRQGPAGKLGLTEYSGVVWAAIFGYCLFAERPSIWTLFGAGLVIGSCVFAFHEQA